jgi:hypothetical protein
VGMGLGTGGKGWVLQQAKGTQVQAYMHTPSPLRSPQIRMDEECRSFELQALACAQLADGSLRATQQQRRCEASVGPLQVRV